MYFDFDDSRPDIRPVGSALSWRSVVVLTVVAHLTGFLSLLIWPDAPPAAARELAAARILPPPAESDPTFVFVQPRVDTLAPTPPERANPSDENREATAPERAARPTNPLPLSRGNTSEFVERSRPETRRGAPDREPAPALEEPPPPPTEPARPNATPAPLGLPEARPPRQPPPRIAGGSLGESLRNLERYIQDDQFNNPQGGGGSFGPFIQFDTKGVDFGRWIARFKRQVESNWLIPLAASLSHGHVMITFNVHKNGNITDLEVVKPSAIPSFNNASLGALSASNPTVPLPPEYPLDKAFFTVTFFYNEEPPRP
jgi:TonB family protein